MKLLFSLLLLSISIFPLYGITVTGKVVDSSTGTPLEYVSIGIVNTSIGTITDENGRFEFKTEDILMRSIVRFSMISYKSQSFTVEELLDKENTIELVSAPVQLAEIVVKPGKLRKIGTTSFSRFGSWCGWGGSYNRPGCEIGSKINLGKSPVLIKSLHIHVHRQAFDSSYFRLHIRTIFKTTLPRMNCLLKISFSQLHENLAGLPLM